MLAKHEIRVRFPLPAHNMLKKKKKRVIVAVSGGFDPVHVGHVRMFEEARKLGDKLVVILNNDNWLLAKKGYVFMPEKERREILEAFSFVDEVFLSTHEANPKDMSVSSDLRKINPDIFANGGDRKSGNTPEVEVCSEIGCKMVYNVGKGGKIQSSSWLSSNLKEALKNRRIRGKK
jgi:cytidyltransferase-like protein